MRSLWIETARIGELTLEPRKRAPTSVIEVETYTLSRRAIVELQPQNTLECFGTGEIVFIDNVVPVVC
jgi:hypothetical protein